MKVHHLIKELSKVDPDLDVTIYDRREGFWDEVTSAEVVGNELRLDRWGMK